ncbi:MAG: hypothetical protein K6G16_03225 [Lachnospiraceae bacterium]|nr:hypothetical protein [Lachnospiraceae bacterium]
MKRKNGKRIGRTACTALALMTALWVMLPLGAQASLSFQLTQYEQAMTAYTDKDATEVLWEYAAGDLVAVLDEDDDFIHVMYGGKEGYIPKTGAVSGGISLEEQVAGDSQGTDASETGSKEVVSADDGGETIAETVAAAMTQEDETAEISVEALDEEFDRNSGQIQAVEEEVERRAKQKRTRIIWGSVIGVLAVAIILINLIPILKGRDEEDPDEAEKTADDLEKSGDGDAGIESDDKGEQEDK